MIFTCLAAVDGDWTVGFHFIEGWDWFDSFYEVLITVTTIGSSHGPPLTEVGRAVQRFRDHCGRGTGIPGNRGAGIGFARIRTPQVLWKASHGARNQSSHAIMSSSVAQDALAAASRANWLSKPAPFVVVDNNPEKMQKLDPALAGHGWRCDPGNDVA